MLGDIAETETKDIFEEGLHQYLTRFIDEIGNLGMKIHDSYLSGDIR